MRILLSALALTVFISATAQVNKYLDLQGYSVQKDHFFDVQASSIGVSTNDTWREVDRVDNKLGSHYRFQQLHKGLVVVNAQYILHTDRSGLVKMANGVSASISDLDTAPGFSSKQVTAFLESQQDIKHVDDVELLIVDEAFPKSSGRYRLAYAASVGLEKDHQTIYIDAHSGERIGLESHVCYHSVPGQGQSFYYGNVTFNVDSLGPDDYLLYDSERDIRVYNDNDDRSEFHSTSPTFDLVNEDKDEVAIDLMWASAGFYDMMKDRFDWIGLDGDSLALEGIVHINQGLPFVNAFWNGQFTHYGDGDCHNSPLTSAMIVAHEYMHGVTDYTSNLIYADESGALNEGMSDIFGKYAQYILLPNEFDWTVDSTIKATELGRVFRDMSNPLSKGNPAYYGGENWQPGGSVHNNSAILNFWFYLLSEGQQGINERDYAYDVSPIGIDAAAQIVWLCQSSYLTPSSTYADMQAASLQVTEQLYGNDSPELAAVIEAWQAVGLGNPSTEELSDLVVEVLTSTSTCETDGAIDLEFELTNVGTKAVEAQTVEFVISDFGFEERHTVEIETAIAPMGTFFVQIVDAFPIDDANSVFIFVDVELIADDDVDENNMTTFFTSNSINPGVDLVPTFAEFNVLDCGSGELELRLGVANEGCDFYINNELITAAIFDPLGTQIGTATFPPVSFLPGGSSTSIFSNSLDMDVAIEDVDFVDIEVDFDGDTNDDNNFFNLQQPLRLLDLSAVEDFETYDALDWSGSNFQVVDFQGTAMLAASSAFTTNSDFYNLCDDLNFVLEDRFAAQSVTSTTTCVDLSGLQSPQLSFDLIQYRTIDGADLPEYEDLTVFTAVEYMDQEGEPVRQFIYGLPEGQLTAQQVSLPQDYVGTLTIHLFSKLGDWVDFPPLERDCQLIDNIRIESLVSTDGLATVPFDITPNPATDQILLKGISAGKYSIYDAQGRPLSAGDIDRSSIDVSTLSAGMYLISVETPSGVVHTDRFVKI